MMDRKIKKISKEDLNFYRAKTKLAFRSALKSAFLNLKDSTGLTQTELAEMLGVDASLVSKKLNGDENLTIESLSDLARALKINLRLEVKSWNEKEEEQIPVTTVSFLEASIPYETGFFTLISAHPYVSSQRRISSKGVVHKHKIKIAGATILEGVWPAEGSQKETLVYTKPSGMALRGTSVKTFGITQ